LDAENGVDLDGRTLKVNFSGERPAGEKSYGASRGGAGGSSESNTVFVGNLGFRTTENGIREFFYDCGEIKDVRISLDEEGRSRGFAYVEFETSQAAKTALEYNGADLDGRYLRIDF